MRKDRTPRVQDRIAKLFYLALLMLPCNLPCQQSIFPASAAKPELGTKDSGAVAEISAFVDASGAKAWHDLVATGTLTYPKGDTHSATLDLLGAEYSRLDVVFDSGTRSIRILKLAGIFQDEHGIRAPIVASSACSGLVAFPRLWTRALNSHAFSLLDKGMYTADGQTLHRITVEYPYDEQAAVPEQHTTSTNLYFDPNSHLLVYSENFVRPTGVRGQPLLRKVRYAQYSQFGGVLVPTLIEETLEGQKQWSLQLNQVSIDTKLPVTTFKF